MPHYNAHCLLRDSERTRAIAPYGGDARPPSNAADFVRLVGSEAFAEFGFARAWPMVYRLAKAPA